jgi:hypothetical protein
MEKRERRRWLTDRYARRAAAEWGRTVNTPFEVFAWGYQEKPLGKYRKWKSLGCPCSKKSHANPKYGWGICYACDIRPTVRCRIDSKRACREWLDAVNSGVHPDDFDPRTEIRKVL